MPTCTQPSFANLSGTATSAQVPHTLLGAFHTDTVAASPVLGDIIFGNSTPAWTKLAGQTSASTLCLTQTGNGTISAAPVWGSCAGAAGTAWSSLTNPAANLALSHAAFTSTFTWGAATGAGVNLFTFTDTANNTGTGILHRIFTASGSAAIPFQADANGIGWRVNTAGNLFPVSTATLAIPGTARGVVVSEGAAAAVATTATGVAGQLLTSNGAGADPTFQDPVISYNAPAESTAAWTSATTVNSAVSVNLITGTSHLSSAVVTLNQGSTITGGVVTFEVSDTTAFTNPYNASCWQETTGNLVTTYTLVASTNQAFVCNVASKAAFRIRLSTVIAGTATVNVGVQPSAGPTHPNAVVSQASGANLHVNVDAAPTTTVTGTVTANQGTPANWVVNVAQWNAVSLGSPSAYGTSPGAVNVPGVNAFITNVPTVTANAGTGNFNIFGTKSTNAGAPGATNLGTLPCLANAAPPALTEGNQIALSCDLSGNIRIVVPGTVAVTQSGVWTVQPGNTQNTTPWLVQGNLSNNGVAAATNRVATLDGIARTDYAGGTAFTAGNNAAPDIGTDGLLHVAALPAIRPATYSASTTTTAAATPTDLAVLPGNATNTALVTRVTCTCTQTTAGIITLNLIKRSTADTLGTSTNTTVVPYDSNYAAAVSVPVTYTANPTLGTAVGNLDTWKGGAMAAGTATPNDIYIGNFKQKPIVLRGTAQQLAINFGGATIAGLACSTTFEWMEVTAITP